jgi:hypothetical protein
MYTLSNTTDKEKWRAGPLREELHGPGAQSLVGFHRSRSSRFGSFVTRLSGINACETDLTA